MIASLYVGAPALTFVLHTAGADENARYGSALAALDPHVTAPAHRVDGGHARITRGELPAFAEYDLLHSLTGIGAHLLQHAPGSDTLGWILAYLVAPTRPLRIDGEDPLSWWASRDLQVTTSSEFPGGHANLGIAYGVSGPFALLTQPCAETSPWTGTEEMSNVMSVSRTSLLAAALTLSACLANASVASAASSSSTQVSMGATHVSMSAKMGLLQGPQTLITPKQAAIDKTKTLLTTFFTDQQLSKILDKMAEDIYANKPFKESFGTLVAPSTLTKSQIAIISTSGVPLTKVLAVLLRRFEPYYNNISKKILAMKSSRKTKADCFNQVYVMVTGYLTKANIAPVLTEIKSGLTSKEWQSLRTQGAALFLWSKYGL